MCKHMGNSMSTVEHYYNEGEYRPNVLDPANATVGLSNSSIIMDSSFLTCKFVRVKKNFKIILKLFSILIKIHVSYLS